MNDQLKRTANTTKALAGRTYDCTYSSGMKVHLEIAEDTVTWDIVDCPNKD